MAGEPHVEVGSREDCVNVCSIGTGSPAPSAPGRMATHMSCDSSWPWHPGSSSAVEEPSLRFARRPVSMPTVLCSGSSAMFHCRSPLEAPTSSGEAGFEKWPTWCILLPPIEAWRWSKVPRREANRDAGRLSLRSKYHGKPIGCDMIVALATGVVVRPPLPRSYTLTLTPQKIEPHASAPRIFADQRCQPAAEALTAPCSGITTHPTGCSQGGFPCWILSILSAKRGAGTWC